MSDELTPTGLITESAPEIKNDLDAVFKGIYGQSIGSESDGSIPAESSIGQEIAIIVEAKASAGEVLQSVFASFDPDEAEGAAQDILCALTGTRRKLARFSEVLATAFGTIGTAIPVGRVVTVEGVGTRFDSIPQATPPTLAAVAATWTATTVYAINDLVNANSKIWQCIGAGTAAAPSPTGTGQQEDGGGVVWYEIAPTGSGVALVQFRAEETGPLAATQGQLNQIATPVDGWAGVTNALGTDSAVNGLGANLEGPAVLRVRRVQELQAQGGGPPDAIRAALLAINDVVAVTVFVNNTDATNGDGLPPHSVNVLILAPNLTDAVLALAVWKAVGGGTNTSNAVGTPVTATVKDASGHNQTVRYSRPTPVPIFTRATVYYDPSLWQVPNVAAAITAAAQSALCTFASAYYESGFQVRVLPLAASIRDGAQETTTDDIGGITPVIPAGAGSAPMPGVVDVALEIHRGADPFGITPVSISAGEIATFDPNNVLITPSSEAP